MTRAFDLDRFEASVARLQYKNRDMLANGFIKSIHADVVPNYNSLNVFCGQQGCGKTYNAIKECAKISIVDPRAHMLIVVCKAENMDDPTIKSLEPLIRVPIVFVNEDEAEDLIKSVVQAKKLYNEIKSNGYTRDMIEDDQIDHICSTLHVDDFDKDWLHTLLVINDSAKCKLLKPGSYVASIMALGRHTQMSSFLNIQYWRGIPTEIKANISTAYIFGTYSRQQLVNILQQLPAQYDYKQIYPIYRKLSKHEFMIVKDGMLM